MLLKTRTVISIGIALTIIHLVLNIMGYSQFLDDTLNLQYLGFSSIFFVFWGCVHLLVGRMYSMNHQSINVSRSNPLMKKHMKLKQYYKTDLTRDEIKRNLSSNAARKNSVYHLDNKGDILISDGTEETIGLSHVGIKLFSDENNITLATEVIINSNQMVSKLKIFVASVLFFCTFLGVIAVLFAFVIHMISMGEILGTQKHTKNHLNKVDEIIQTSIQISNY